MTKEKQKNIASSTNQWPMRHNAGQDQFANSTEMKEPE